MEGLAALAVPTGGVVLAVAGQLAVAACRHALGGVTIALASAPDSEVGHGIVVLHGGGRRGREAVGQAIGTAVSRNARCSHRL